MVHFIFPRMQRRGYPHLGITFLFLGIYIGSRQRKNLIKYWRVRARDIESLRYPPRHRLIAPTLRVCRGWWLAILWVHFCDLGAVKLPAFA